jgi:AcrR family transcriptional regulator
MTGYGRVKRSIVASKAYHHGELRQALVDAALALLEREGAEALSLRGLARAVGVSAMAPYHHFTNRADLLVAVAAEGFRRLMLQKVDALRTADGDPAAALVAGTASYVEFVADHPQLYRLMKGPAFADRGAHPELQAAAAAPAASLHALMQKLLAGRTAGITPARGAQLLWSLSHGIGTLVIDGQIDRATAPALARDGARALIRGWLAA